MIPTDLDFATLLTGFGICVQIFFIDLLMSADNAVMIALACRGLPPEDMRRAATLGTLGAIGLRVAMAAGVLVLMQVPYLKIVAGATLLVIAIRLTLGHDDPDAAGSPGRRDLAGAVVAIILADAVMSLDNVVAIAAVAQGSLLLLGFGLLLSVPMLIGGSAMIRQFLGRNGLLIAASGMFLGWVAGQIAVSDPVLTGWVAASAPALVFAVPAACAVFVLWESRILAASRARAEEGFDVR